MKKDNSNFPLVIDNLTIKFEKNSIPTLDGVSFSIKESGIYGLTGPSGSGKTTLLNIISGILIPDSGTIKFGDVDILSLSNEELLEFRRENLGFIFQESNLIEEFTILENIGLKGIIKGEKIDSIRKRSEELILKLGMEDLIHRNVNDLSTGEKARISILRAVFGTPSIIIADEPTGNLDSENSLKIMNLLQKIVKENNIAVIVATHDMEWRKIAKSEFQIKDIGKQQEEVLPQRSQRTQS